MDIRGSIEQKANILVEQANAIRKINIEWQQPVEIVCADLSMRLNLDVAKELKAIKVQKNRSAIYYFRILNSLLETKDILSALEGLKRNTNISCPQMQKENSNTNSKYLYCGSVSKISLYSRLNQHLGFGYEKTYALHLLQWAKSTGLVLEFNYAWLEKSESKYAELIESALANEIQPLVGKRA